MGLNLSFLILSHFTSALFPVTLVISNVHIGSLVIKIKTDIETEK